MVICTCPYCGGDLKSEIDFYYCGFCEMSITTEDAQENGQRKQIPFLLNNVTISDADENTMQLMQRSTNDLIVMLRLVRQKRTDFYNYLRVLNKAKGDFQEHVELTGKDYEYWTRKTWVLENILRDRTGVFPERITDDYLSGLAVRADKINGKSMRIRAKKQKIQDTK
ncbi:hypothetical protein [Paenibacillus sp. O199]|uniref:hypothetical protein n=1 Tax=Paenibacillus sp. O199 TaxID=1643925 RepID=UPI0007BFE953|nr:hypothetical protein [Paenibacillus sp. O199]